MKYRKKPVVIEAVRYGHDLLDVPASRNDPAWITEAFESGVLHYNWPVSPLLKADLFIKTLEGELKVNNGDYIIRGVKGELYPCKPDIFKATYELAE